MVNLARRLIGKGIAYEKLRSIYFDISRFPGYGKLSKLDLNKIKLGSTTDLDDYEKDNPRDFTLLKRIKLSELKRGIYTKTEWGNIRPGWHIECAAMAMKYLGESFDIHTSSRALIFPHHENEIAICESLTEKPLARYWLHSAQVLAHGKNVDSVSDKRLTVRKLLDRGYTGRELRFWLFSKHYRKPLHFSDEELQQARHTIERLDEYGHRLQHLQDGRPYQELDQLIYDLKQGFTNAMDEDLNIAEALSTIFKFVKKINKLMGDGFLDKPNVDAIISVFKKIDAVLHIFSFESQELSAQLASLLQERTEARRQKDWARADQIRALLKEKGFVVKDTLSGPVLRPIR